MTLDQQQEIIDYLSGIINDDRQELLKSVIQQRTRHITVVMEDFYQPHNASAVIRSCECLGLQEVHIIENDNEYLINPEVVQGSSKWVELNRYNLDNINNTEACVENLKNRGFAIASTTLSDTAISLDDIAIEQPIALCFGTEETGISDDLYELSDIKVKIPMHGFTQSFNVSVSAGICLYQLCHRLRQSNIDWQLSEEEQQNILIQWLAQSTPSGEAILRKIQQTMQEQ